MSGLDQGENKEALGLPSLKAFETSWYVDKTLGLQGRLSKNHPLSQYVEGLFSRIHGGTPEIEIEILANSPDVNACATIDGRILVNRGLLEFCKTEEELLFVLKHERKHIVEGHIARLNAANSSNDSNVLGVNIGKIGMERIFEMGEADVEVLNELDRDGVNIEGAFTFMHRLNEHMKGSGDLSHGSGEDRLMAFRATLSLRDYVHFREGKQTSRPSELDDSSLYQDDWFFPVTRAKKISPKERRATLAAQPDLWAKRREKIGEMTLFQLHVNVDRMRESLADEHAALEAIRARASKFQARTLAAREPFFNDVSALYEEMKAVLFAKMQQEIGLSSVQYEATQEIRACVMSEEFKLSDLFDDKSKLDALLSIDDLNAWGALFRGVNVIRNVGDLESLVGAHYSDLEYEKCLNILTFLLTGEWCEKGEQGTEALTDGANEGPEPDFSNEERKFLNDVYLSRYEINPSGWGLDGSLVNLRDRILAFDRGKPYSQVFKTLISAILTGAGRMNHEDLSAYLSRLDSQLDDSFERNLVYIFMMTVLSVSFGASSQKNFDETYAGLVQLTRLHEEMNSEYVDFDYVAIALRSLCSELLPSCLSEGFETILALKADLSERMFNEVVTIWYALTDDDLEIGDVTWLREEGLLPIMGSRDLIYAQSANDVSQLMVSDEDIDTILDCLEESRETPVQAFSDNERIQRLDQKRVAFYHLLNAVSSGADLNRHFRVLRVAQYAVDTMDRYVLERKVWSKILSEDFIEDVEDFLDSFPERVDVPFYAMYEIIEKYAKTDSALRACQAYMEGRLKNPEAVGKMVLTHEGVSKLLQRGVDRVHLLKAALARKSDEELKKVLMQGFMLSVDVRAAFLLAGLDDPLYSDLYADEVGHLKKDPFAVFLSGFEMAPQLFLERLQSMDELQRRAFIHALLTGKEGIMHDPTAMAEIVDFLFDEYVDMDGDEDDRTFVMEVRKLIKIMIGKASPEEAYMVLSGVLSKRLFQADSKSWEDLEDYDEYRNGFELINVTTAFINLSNAGERAKKVSDLDVDVENDIARVPIVQRVQNKRNAEKIMKCLVYGKSGDNKRVFQEHREPVEALLSAEIEKRPTTMGAVGLLLEIAESLKSIGTRGLQSMDMYWDLPERYTSVRDRIYSDMEGQSKLTAYETMKRHMKPEDLEDLEIGERIGGGAMVTVYPFKSKTLNGVVKVLNPNVTYFTDVTFRILEQSFAELMIEDADRYRILSCLLEDIRWWVKADMDLTASAEDDRQFAEDQSGGSTVEGIRFEVPQVYFSTKQCLVEAIARGQSLDRIALTEVTRKKVVDAIRGSIQSQVMKGIVHSDIHPGNVMFDEEAGVLSWIDRTLLLKLREEDKMMLFQIAMAASDEARLNVLLDSLLAMPENVSLGDAERIAIRGELSSLPEGSLDQKIKTLSVRLRQYKGFNIAPHLTLVLKNMLALGRLEERIPLSEG